MTEFVQCPNHVEPAKSLSYLNSWIIFAIMSATYLWHCRVLVSLCCSQLRFEGQHKADQCRLAVQRPLYVHQNKTFLVRWNSADRSHTKLIHVVVVASRDFPCLSLSSEGSLTSCHDWYQDLVTTCNELGLLGQVRVVKMSYVEKHDFSICWSKNAPSCRAAQSSAHVTYVN